MGGTIDINIQDLTREPVAEQELREEGLIKPTAKTNDWETDPRFFRLLNHEHHFAVDGFAHAGNHLLPRYWGPGSPEAADAFALLTWECAKGPIFCNPEYNGQQGRAMQRGYDEALHNTVRSGFLVPAYTDTQWWWDTARVATRVRLLKGRLTFFYEGKRYTTARFPSAVVFFDQDVRIPGRLAKVDHWDWRGEYKRVFGDFAEISR